MSLGIEGYGGRGRGGGYRAMHGPVGGDPLGLTSLQEIRQVAGMNALAGTSERFNAAQLRQEREIANLQRNVPNDGKWHLVASSSGSGFVGFKRDSDGNVVEINIDAHGKAELTSITDSQGNKVSLDGETGKQWKGIVDNAYFTNNLTEGASMQFHGEVNRVEFKGAQSDSKRAGDQFAAARARWNEARYGNSM